MSSDVKHFDFEYSSNDEELKNKEDPKPYDWYFEWSRISPLLKKKHIKEKNDVLVIGCGNSTMSNDLVSEGFKNIINIDISPVVIKQMQKTYKGQNS